MVVARIAKKGIKKAAEEVKKKRRNTAQTPVARMIDSKGKTVEAARLEPISGSSYKSSAGYGKSTTGKKSVAAFDSPVQAAANKKIRSIAKKYVDLKNKERSGKKLTVSEKKFIAKIDKVNDLDTQRAIRSMRKSAEAKKTKAKGVSLPGSEKVGGRTALGKNKGEYSNQKDYRGDKIEVDAYGNPKGNTITKDGEIIGNPTQGQLEAAARNFASRNAKVKDRELQALITKIKNKSTRPEIDSTGAAKSKVRKTSNRTTSTKKGVFKRKGGKLRGMGVALRGGGKVSRS